MSAKATLNARQEAFARGLAEGKSQRQAYMAAGYDSKGTTADENGSWLLANAKVAARVSELRKRAAEMSEKTVTSLVADLDEAIALARECRAPGAMIAGIMGQGKLLGLVVDKAQVEAIIRRPSPAPGIQTGVILSEEDWQQRLLARPHANGQG